MDLQTGEDTAVHGNRTIAIIILVLVSAPLFAAAGAEGAVPTTVPDLWADFDPRAEPLESQVVRQWEDDGLVLRHVVYNVSTFKGVDARMAGYYGFPEDGRRMPGLLHLHGGGQRAFLHEVKYYARRGYACLSINWGGREMENARPGDPNTDWGAVDPTQRNVPGYFNLQPGTLYLDPDTSPRNNNWYLLTVGARRGLTFLERQEEVDPNRLGVYGHSMGGNLTVYVAGTDRRVKVAAPSAGGQGFRSIPWSLLPAQRKLQPAGDVELYRSTLGFQSYAPLVSAPLLWLGATNDFHGIMDDTYRTGALIPHAQVRYSFAPHLNHRFTPAFAVTRPLWIDQHLKGTFQFPATPESRLILNDAGGVPRFSVTPDASRAIADVRIYYAVDPDPQARFWRSAAAERSGPTWTATLPILSVEEPLFAFANVHYRLDGSEDTLFAPPTRTVAISSLLHTATPAELDRNGVRATDERSAAIDGFSRGFADWYQLSADNPHHWQFWTRKISDPKWQGQPDDRLAFDVRAEKPNALIVILTENFFRPYRGRQRDLIATVDLPGGTDWHSVGLAPSRFKTPEGDGSPESWSRVDLLGFRAYYGRRDDVVAGSTQWAGSQPDFRNLRWVSPANKE